MEKLQRSQTGFKFRRQASIGSYIVDFYCPMRKLAIELDGPIHKRRNELDKYRTKTLEEMGIKVLRFWNDEVENDIEKVLERINTTLFNSPS